MALNQYTGRSNRSLENSHAKKCAYELKIRRGELDDEEMGGGSPLEGFYDDWEDLMIEMKRRDIEVKPVCELCGDERTHMEGRMYPGGHTEVTVHCAECSAPNLRGQVVEF